MTKEIQLTKGKIALVDDEDFEYLNQWGWCYSAVGYAIRNDYSGRVHKMVYMHRQVMKDPYNLLKTQIDHIDRNMLNNQKSNLRFCSPSQNGSNKTQQRNNTSGYKGVSYDKSRDSWDARIQVNGKPIRLGRFATAKLAAIAYDKEAIKHLGDLAYLNFPRENYE